jgi:hypothetical protein
MASLWSPTDWPQRLAELQAPTGELKEAPLRRDVRSLGVLLGEVLREAVGCVVSGDVETGKSVLRKYINGTVGFVALGEAVSRSSKTLMQMLGPRGKPPSPTSSRSSPTCKKSKVRPWP